MKNKVEQLQLIKDEKIDEIKYYVAFSYLFVRPLFKAKLFEYFDYDIKRAYSATKQDLKNVAQEYDISIPRDFIEKRDILNIEECYKNAFLDNEVKILTYHDEKYPPLLKEIPDFPLSLYYKGDIDKIDYEYNVAIVGSRQASESAKLSLRSILSKLKNSNIVVVSGLAYGIDTQAHQSALDNNLKTIAVVGSGLDIIYPSQNKKLFRDILDNGGIIFSEYPLKTRPMAQNFPQRNRIVVGMSKGTLVAEAKLKSGAMISANLTLDYNRELMCIPGNILNPNTSGIYYLIKNGAGIIADSTDLLNQMGWDIIFEESNVKKNSLDEFQQKVMDALLLEAKTFDEIIEKTGQDISKTMVALTELELKGLIKQSNNKYYRCE